jgi:hypothetical protein
MGDSSSFPALAPCLLGRLPDRRWAGALRSLWMSHDESTRVLHIFRTE